MTDFAWPLLKRLDSCYVNSHCQKGAFVILLSCFSRIRLTCKRLYNISPWQPSLNILYQVIMLLSRSLATFFTCRINNNNMIYFCSSIFFFILNWKQIIVKLYLLIICNTHYKTCNALARKTFRINLLKNSFFHTPSLKLSCCCCCLFARQFIALCYIEQSYYCYY